jgi:hypothetical protein
MQKFKILVCGGRDYNDRERIYRVLDNAAKALGDIIIIHGGANGADKISGDWASERNFDVEVYPADWDKYKKAAGFIRNSQMLNEGKPDIVLAFPGGKGTAMMISIAEKAGVKVRKYQ